MEKLRKSIRRTLKARGMTVEAFADEIELGRSTMFQLMQDGAAAAPRFDTLKKLKQGGVAIPKDLFT